MGGKRLRVSVDLNRLVDGMRGFESPCNSKQHNAQVAKDELAGEEEEAAGRTRRCLRNRGENLVRRGPKSESPPLRQWRFSAEIQRKPPAPWVRRSSSFQSPGTGSPFARLGSKGKSFSLRHRSRLRTLVRSVNS